jgi:hypothetical protein
MKNTVYLIVIVVCLVLAAVIAYKYIFSPGGGGIDDISEDERTWVKCRNSECNAEYEIALKGYYKYMEENADPLARSAPGLPCEKCGKNSAFIAEKCGNPDCAIVFTKGSVPNDFVDRCPECKRSETEEIRKKRAAGG